MKIRSVALAIIRKEDQILVQEITFPNYPTTFYRPIGGTIELGENSKRTLIRELYEELNQEIEEPNLVAVIENIFGTEEEIGHEIDFIYEARFKDSTLYNREEIEGMEGHESYKAIWKPINYFIETEEDVKLVPDGLLGILTKQGIEKQKMIRHIS